MNRPHFVLLDPRLAEDPRVAAMAVTLRRDPYWVAGHFPQFVYCVIRHAPDGDLSGIPDDLLDDWAGGVKLWGALFRTLFCDERGVVVFDVAGGAA